MRNFDFVSVVFSADMPLLHLQMKSLTLFCSAEDFGRYVIIVNEPAPLARDLRDEIENWSSGSWLHDKLVVMVSNEVFPFNNSVRGWRRQQAIKLSVTDFCGSSHALILDAKNHLIRRFDKGRLFDEHGRVLTTNMRIKNGDQREWLSDSLARLNVGNGINLDSFSSPPTTTPYLLSIEEAQCLKDEVVMSGETWGDFFRRIRGRETEFFLYAAWIYKKYGSFDRHFFTEPRGRIYNVTLFGRYPSSPDQIESFLKKLPDESIQFMGFHRARMEHVMSESSPYSEVRQMWIRSGLFRDESEISNFFAAGHVA